MEWEQKVTELETRMNAAARAYRRQNQAVIKLLGLTEQHLQSVITSIQEIKLQLATGLPLSSTSTSPPSGPDQPAPTPSPGTPSPSATSPPGTRSTH